MEVPRRARDQAAGGDFFPIGEPIPRTRLLSQVGCLRGGRPWATTSIGSGLTTHV